MTELERDRLTGLVKGVQAARNLRELLLRASVCEEEPVTLTVIDIDDLVAINNKAYGYEIGDVLLKELAHSFEAEICADETPYRFGGDEFLIISPAISTDDAKLRAERIRKTVKGLAPAPIANPGVVTVTVGLAFWPKDGASPQALTMAADRAVRQGKSQGGDCVTAL